MSDDDPEYWKIRGNEEVKLKNYSKGIDYYKIALEIDPNYSPAWHNMGQVYKIMGDERNSELCFKKEVESEKKSKKSLMDHTVGLMGRLGGAVKAGTRRVAYELLIRKHNAHLKELIVREFDLKDLKKMSAYFRIGSPQPTRTNNYGEIVSIRPNRGHWEDHIIENLKLSTLKEYSRKHNKLPYEIVELEEQYREERLEKYPEYESNETSGISSGTKDYQEDEFLQELIKVIKEYRPVKPFKNEYLYHTNLYTYLTEKIPGDVGFEIQKGSSRPDLVIGDIAIEIKGPTDRQGLVTIADKINRYSQHFEYLVVVLFEVDVYDRYYNEWYNSIMRQYKDQVTIIRK